MNLGQEVIALSDDEYESDEEHLVKNEPVTTLPDSTKGKADVAEEQVVAQQELPNVELSLALETNSPQTSSTGYDPDIQDDESIIASVIVERIPDNPYAVFEAPLSFVVNREQSFIPNVVSESIELLRNSLHKTAVGGIDQILKGATGAVVIAAQQYRNMYYNKGYVVNLGDLLNTSKLPMSGIAWLLYEYLRSLPSSLVVHEAPLIKLAQKKSDDESRLRHEICLYFLNLPAENYLTFKAVLSLIHEIIESKKSVSFNIQKISELFGPLLFKSSASLASSTLQLLLSQYSHLRKELSELESLARYKRLLTFNTPKLSPKQLLQYLSETVRMIELYCDKYKESELFRNEYELRKQGFDEDEDDAQGSPGIIILVRKLLCPYILQIFKTDIWMPSYYQPIHVIETVLTTYKNYLTQRVGFIEAVAKADERNTEERLEEIRKLRESEQRFTTQEDLKHLNAMQFVSVCETVSSFYEIKKVAKSSSATLEDLKFVSLLIVCINKNILGNIMDAVLLGDSRKGAHLSSSYWARAPLRNAAFVQEIIELFYRLDQIKLTFNPFLLKEQQ